MSKLIDMCGNVYGRLTVLLQGDTDKSGQPSWWCLCECGEIFTALGSNLRYGQTKSCGCFRVDEAIKRTTKHGASRTRLYNTWHHMKQRCLDVSCKGYRWYGGKGIRICKEWLDFDTFKVWANNNGYNKNLTIDRLNSKGNYEPLNCEWVTKEENLKRMWGHRKNEN